MSVTVTFSDRSNLYIYLYSGSFEHGFFPRTIPTAISSWGRRDPVFKPETLEGSTSGSSFSAASRWRPVEQPMAGPSDEFGQ